MNNSNTDYSLFLEDEVATESLASSLSKVINTYLSDTCITKDQEKQNIRIYLNGELGAGKTSFARAFLRAFGVKGRIKSPTYTLLETYKVSRLYLYHFDFYRFNDANEWQEAGFEEQLYDQAITLVEWSEKAGPNLPQADLEINLSYNNNGREAHFVAVSNKGQTWLNQLRKQTFQ